MVLKVNCTSDSLGALVKTQITGPHPGNFWFGTPGDQEPALQVSR